MRADAVPAALASRGLMGVTDDLPFGGGLDMAADFVRSFRDEIEARMLVRRRPEPAPREFLPDHLAEARRIAREHGLFVVVKLAPGGNDSDHILYRPTPGKPQRLGCRRDAGEFRRFVERCVRSA